MRRIATLAASTPARVKVFPIGRRDAHFAGLRDEAPFVSEPKFLKAAAPIPVLRIVGEDGHLVEGAKLPFSLDEVAGMYQTMLRCNVMDEVLNSLQRQGRISFYMTGSGEEAAQVGTAAALGKRDVIWTQYRELGVFLHRGFTMQQAVDQCLGRANEPGKGRQMPIHYCDAEIGMQAVTSPLATQIPQAVGAGYAYRVANEPRCGVAYFGDGAASEGDFAVALNFAATLKAQTLFICRNNGWAISTPAKEQYAGDGIAARGIAYGMETIRVDGNDLAAVFQATAAARQLCLEGQPVLIELMTYRRGHHSTSDDATRYREGSQVDHFSRSGLEPISRVRLLLQHNGRWTPETEQQIREQAKSDLMAALQTGEAKKFAPIRDMFTDVWAELPPNLKRQREELREHLQRHEEHYAERLQRFEGGLKGV